ncbi:hypothetical protein KFL_000070400 [Klebsormidium nitens]|uniref:RAP domain-containing protein n=1 Tax=Klebsormidium nitens TaxID=105231 RepID=A0A1Y1HM57_KLENI|nr:hypothetical protein KFL_000070400 [Klebsormidium nitens]|eukprot:GAQ78071.1 hypothetical protein KFL_000070400 [Klebsormidium nitens]
MASAGICRTPAGRTSCFCGWENSTYTSRLAAQPASGGVVVSGFLTRVPASFRRSGLLSSGCLGPLKRLQKRCDALERFNNVRAGAKKKAASKLVASAKKGSAKGTAVLEVEKEEAAPQLEKAESAEEDDLGDGFENEEEAKAFAAQFADFFEEDDSEEDDNENEEGGNEYEEEEDGPVEIDWEYGSDLGSKLGEVFDPIDLGIGKEWPKPWAEVPETYNWSTRTAARREESAKLHRIDMSYLNADEERKERLKQKRKLREKGLLRTRWDNEKEVFNDNELLSVNGRIIRGPEDAWAAWMADRGRDDILGETDWKALGIEKPRPVTFAEKLGKVTRAEAQRRRKKARVDPNQEEYLHKRILDAKTMDEVLEAMEAAFDEAGISYSGQVERDWAPMGALSSVNIAMAVHRVGRFAFREGLSRKDKMSLLRQAPVQRLLRMAYEVLGRCDPQGVANMAWGLSRLAGAGLLPSDYLDEVAKQAIRRLRKARPQHLANLAGAFASLNHAAPLLMDGVLVHACARGVAAFRPQEVAQIVWSCAVLNHSPTKFLDEIDAWVAEQTAKFEAEKLESQQTTGALRGSLPWREYEDEPSSTNPETLDSSSKSLETGEIENGSGREDKPSFLEARASVSQGASDSSQSEKLRTSDETVSTSSGKSALHALSAQVDELAGKVNELAASLRPSDGPTLASESGSGAFDSLSGQSESGSGASESESGASEASTSARPSFTQFFGLGAGNPFAEYGALHVANLAWAYAVLGETRRPAFARIWEEVERKRSVAFDEKMMSQLWQVHLTLKLEEQDLNLDLEPALLKQKAEQVWNAEKDGEKTVSTYQLELERALSDMGKQFSAEYTDAEYSIDVAIPAERIAFEVDGPSHFARNTGTPLGATLLKRRHLAASGWTVLPINFNYWDTLKGEKEQQGYLKQLLRTAKDKERANDFVVKR